MINMKHYPTKKQLKILDSTELIKIIQELKSEVKRMNKFTYWTKLD